MTDLIPTLHAFSALGSRCALEVHAGSDAQGAAAIAMALAEIERIQTKFSRYDPESFLSAINRVAAIGGSITVDDETADLLDYAAACYAKSDGAFDITSGLLRKVWNFASGQLPAQRDIDALLLRIGWQRLVWERPLLRFPLAGMEIDLGGIGKEYAVDRVAALLKDAGIRHGVVDLGGDMAILGPRPDGAPWRIGLRHARIGDALCGETAILSGAIATSGDYERFIDIDGRRYSHLLDPRTGWPVTGLASVTVVAPACMVAGSLASIAMLKGTAGKDWLADMKGPHAGAQQDGATGGHLPPQINLARG